MEFNRKMMSEKKNQYISLITYNYRIGNIGRYIFMFSVCVFIFGWKAIAQKQQSLTLPEAIHMAQANSVDAAVALNELKTAYWEYRTYRADLLPEMSFEGILPNYKQSYSLYQTEDGSFKYVRNDVTQLRGKFSVDQNISLTGGRISFNSSLEFVKPNGNPRHYMSVPIGITLNQPIFGFNWLKWKKKIQPVRYREAKAAYVAEVEQTTLKTINYYFDLLLAEENVLIAKQNKENADRLFEVAKAKRSMGQLSENELLQLELNGLKADAKLTDEQSNKDSKMFQLLSFLGLESGQKLSLEMPGTVDALFLRYEEVIEKAHLNNSFAQRIRRIQLEAERDVAQAKGNKRQIDLFASIGYTGRDENFSDAYHNLKDNQLVQIGVKIPLLDWGKRKGKIKVAESNRDVINSRLRREEQQFDQNIYILVGHFNNQARQLEIARKADQIAERRYKTSIETFMIGKISTLELNDAQKAKDEARQKHISELFFYWYYLYQVRSVTLYDFANQRDLDADFERLIHR